MAIRSCGRKELNRLTISVHCLRQCVEIMDQLASASEGSVIYGAALSYAIILYASPFMDNEKSPTAKATPRVKHGAIVKQLSAEDKILHEKLIELRKRALAHTEWEYYPTSIDSNGIISSKSFSLSVELQWVKLGAIISLAKRVLTCLESERLTCWSHVQNGRP